MCTHDLEQATDRSIARSDGPSDGYAAQSDMRRYRYGGNRTNSHDLPSVEGTLLSRQARARRPRTPPRLRAHPRREIV